MTGKGYIPPPIDLSETLKNYYTTSEFNNLLSSNISKYFPKGNIFITNNSNEDPSTLYGGAWNLINGSYTDEEYLNMYFNTTNLSIIKESDETKWLQLYYYHYTNSGKSLFANLQQALRCNASNKISNLYLLLEPHDILLGTDEKYEMKIVFPETSVINRWKQSSNPLATDSTNIGVTNYTAIDIDTTTNYWGGMSMKNSYMYDTVYCLLSGSQNSTNWYYATAPFELWNGAIPSYNSGLCQEIAIYIRLSKLENKNNFLNDLNLLSESNVYIWKRSV